MANGCEDANVPSPPALSNGNIMETKNESIEKTLAQSSKRAPIKPASSFDAADLTDKTLKFLSTASNETLGGIAVGLAVCTYLLLGRLGLVLIGMLGGIVLHASWEEHNATPGAAEDARKAKGLDIVRRVLDLRDIQDKGEGDGPDADGDITVNGFANFRPETAAALNEFVEAVIRDYVKWWYDPILPNEHTFPSASRATFTSFLVSISNHLSRKRPADTFLDFLTNSTSVFIVFLNELSHAFSTSSSSSKTSAEVVYEYLAKNPDSNLANVLNEKLQRRKFQMAAEDLLQNFLDKSVYNCSPARIFLQQAMARLVMETSLHSCSKPEWINGWIVYLLEEGETELMEAIDAGMSNPVDGFDGNVGNISLAKPTSTPESKPKSNKSEEKRHQKRLSRAEEAMEEAMEEAKRLSQLIAEDDAKKSPSDIPEPKVLGLPTVVENPNSPYPLESPFASMINGHYSEAQEGSTSPVTSSDLASPRTPSSNTTFDQILPKSSQEKSPLTLHNATITIYDDSAPGDKGKIRSKPTTEYMLQIEPESSQHPGWMIPRKYADFEPLHEVIRRIAAVSGVTAFTEQHSSLPHWKGHTKSSFRGELERYLRDACWYQPLAESEGMRRFLEKDRGYTNESSKEGFAGIGWPTPQTFGTMGKGVIDVLASAPKGAAEGGKAVFGGVTGVITNIGSLGNSKKSPNPSVAGMNIAGRTSVSSLSRKGSNTSVNGLRGARTSEDSTRVTSPVVVATQPPVMPQMERRPSYTSNAESENEAPGASRLSFSARSSISGRGSKNASRDPSQGPSLTTTTSPIRGPSYEDFHLPPPPSDMPDDYGSHVPGTPTSISTAPSFQSPHRTPGPPSARATTAPPGRPRKDPAALSIPETTVAVELIFAVINELYTLSSAWNIRRTLLNAAKTFLLRPGNPSLIAIQSLIQDDLIAAHTSDAGVAAHLRALRANSLPTEAERRAWPPEISAEEKERLRVKARRLLVERGVPAALTGVMGQAATVEAMGRVFDCLQVEEVARGLICGVLLQGVRAVTH